MDYLRIGQRRSGRGTQDLSPQEGRDTEEAGDSNQRGFRRKQDDVSPGSSGYNPET